MTEAAVESIWSSYDAENTGIVDKKMFPIICAIFTVCMGQDYDIEDLIKRFNAVETEKKESMTKKEVTDFFVS